MKEVTGNLWTYPSDFRTITTNGTIRNDGACVMGRGVARQAANNYPRLPFLLGEQLKISGNHVMVWQEFHLFTYPVKHNWWEQADPDLIVRSAIELVELHSHILPIPLVGMVRPGCGNGGLLWKNIKALIEPILGDSFMVVEL